MKDQILTNASVALLVIVVFAVCPKLQAVNPPPDGGYPGGNTAEGQNVLLSLTSGTFNTAVGFSSLQNITMGNLNTATGAAALFANKADQNIATGAAALLSNTSGANNTADGTFTLAANTVGQGNTAIGTGALSNNTIGSQNTAIGASALRHNTTANGNTADSFSALFNNTTGNENTAIGDLAGFNQTTGSNNVYIGSGITGVAGESNACYIASIFGQASANGVQVLIGSDNKLGTSTSSKRFKDDIKPIGPASEALFALKPVTFRYKREIDPARRLQLGLVAEDVAKVDPGLVVLDKEGKPYSVRYDQVNAMLLSEFLKEHRKVKRQESQIREQEQAIAQLRSGMDGLTATVKQQAAQIQKVSARIELSQPKPETVAND